MNDNLKIIKKILIALLIMFVNVLMLTQVVYATRIESADLYTTGYCGELLKYKGIPVLVHYIEYNNNGITYPAYCVNREKDGSEEERKLSKQTL